MTPRDGGSSSCTKQLVVAVKAAVASCPACRGSGRVEIMEYDSASGEAEYAGTSPCLYCTSMRKALEACSP